MDIQRLNEKDRQALLQKGFVRFSSDPFGRLFPNPDRAKQIDHYEENSKKRVYEDEIAHYFTSPPSLMNKFEIKSVTFVDENGKCAIGVLFNEHGSTDMYYAWSFDNTADPDTMN